MKKTVLRDNLESIAVAVVLVLAVRQFIVEAYKIPTGSMAPALVGTHREVRCPECGVVFRVGADRVGARGELLCPRCAVQWPGGSDEVVRERGLEDTIVFRQPAWLWHQGQTLQTGRTVTGPDAANRIRRWGSRIFVNKFVYRLRSPRRWELAVFDYPYGDKNYIKRIVGLPGETVAIRDGDIFINGSIARKPRRIQRQMWIPVLDTAHGCASAPTNLWDFGPAAERWDVDRVSGALRVDAGDAGRTVFARLDRTVRDFYAYNGMGNLEGRSGRHRVDSVQLRATVRVRDRADESAMLGFRVGGGAHDFRIEWPLGAGGELRLLDGARAVRSAPAPPLTVGKRHEVSVERYDGMLAVDVDGREVMRHEYCGSGAFPGQEQFIGVGASGVQAEFQRIRLNRDVYYLPGSSDFGPVEYVLDDASYFVLGDNSPYSSDSREWPSHGVPAKNLIGRAVAVFWPVADIRWIRAGRAEP